MYWYIEGDTHGDYRNFPKKDVLGEDAALIILGDAGINYFLNYRDDNLKIRLNKIGYLIYVVQGNHELHPSNIDTYSRVWDENINGYVWVEELYPNIRFFDRFGAYNIGGNDVLVLGGAYSVDKARRLEMGYSWFADEQLSEEEREQAFALAQTKHWDYVLTHTCPVNWEPVELFLPCVDQSTVDKTMEFWLQEVEENIDYDRWKFGHYHADKIINDKAEMLFHSIREMRNKGEQYR